MASINTTIPAPNYAPVISRVGSDDVFAELSFRRLGALIELVCTRVEYSAMTGRYIREELSRAVVDEDDADSVACDMQWTARQNLEETNNYGPGDPVGFEEAVIRESEALTPAIAAE